MHGVGRFNVTTSYLHSHQKLSLSDEMKMALREFSILFLSETFTFEVM